MREVRVFPFRKRFPKAASISDAGHFSHGMGVAPVTSTTARTSGCSRIARFNHLPPLMDAA